MAQIVSGGSELLQPSVLLKEHLGIQPGQVVADFGCGGSGYNTLESARLVGDQGQIYAIDIVKEVLISVDGKAKLEGLYNIKTVWSDLEMFGATDIPEKSLDHGILVNIFFQSKKHADIIKEVSRLMKPGAKILVVDWNNVHISFGPPEGDRVAVESLREMVPSYGYDEEKMFEAGPYHFGLIFRKI